VLCHSQPPTDASPMSTFSVHRFAVSDSVSVLILRGEPDLLAAASLRSPLDDLAADGYRRLVLDVSPLQFVDSTGLGVLIAFQRTLGQRLALAEPQAFVSGRPRHRRSH
jgi:anti-anti-sigma factor